MCENPCTYSFICQGTKNLFGLPVKLPFVTTTQTTKGKGNPIIYLQLKETTSEFVCFYTIPLIFNNK